VRILIAGGTSFVGRAIAWSALRQGHEVTVINRGVTPNDLPDSVERLVGDRQGDLSALAQRTFDATVDTVAYRPSDVVALAKALDGRGGHHLQISSVSAYSDPPSPGLVEAAAELWPGTDLDLDGPITNESYGPLKAACERSAVELFGEPLTIVRPTFVIGAFDATLRFPYWVERVRRGGAVVVPGPRSNFMQYVDARDLADFSVGLLANGVTGAFHAAGPTPADHFVAMVERIAKHIAPEGTTIHEVDAQRVLSANLETKFPLWSGEQSENAMAVDNSLAVENGLRLRDLSDSVDEVVSWWADRSWPHHWLTNEEEAQLL
jgi:2'-hydroxyisoflavone reductase